MVGVASNALGYLAYLFLTSTRIGSIQAMSYVYFSSCLVSFLGNKNWTFGDSSQTRKILPRYIFIQVLGYLTNLLLLMVFYRLLGFPHQWVQFFAISVVAIELFILSKYYAFSGGQSGAMQ